MRRSRHLGVEYRLGPRAGWAAVDERSDDHRRNGLWATRQDHDMTTAVYTGSFDPLHDGHMSIVEQAARQFDRLILAPDAHSHHAVGLTSGEGPSDGKRACEASRRQSDQRVGVAHEQVVTIT